MNVTETLRKAWAAVQEADLPEQVHEVAFREAVRLLTPGANEIPGKLSAGGASGNAITSEGRPSGDPADDAARDVSESEMYDRVARQTGVDRNRLEHLVHMDNDGPRISIAGIKLGKTNAERVRAVAQILTMTRGFGLEESETPLEIIRAECDRLKVYDRPNFSTHMKALNGYVITGTGQNRRLRAKGPGVAAFPAFVDSLLRGD